MSQTSRENKRHNPASSSINFLANHNPVTPFSQPCHGLNAESTSLVNASHLYETGLVQGNHINLNKSLESGSEKLTVTSNGTEKKKPRWLVQLIKKKKAEEARNLYENLDYFERHHTSKDGKPVRNGIKSDLTQEKDSILNPGVKSIPEMSESNSNSQPVSDSSLFSRVIPSSQNFQPVFEIPDFEEETSATPTSFYCFNPSQELEVRPRVSKDHEKYYNIHELCTQETERKNEGQKEVIRRGEDQRSFHHQVEREICGHQIQVGREELQRGFPSRSGDHLNFGNKFNKANNSKTTTTIVTSNSSSSTRVVPSEASSRPVRGILKKKTLQNSSNPDTTNCSLFLTPPVPSSDVDPFTISHPSAHQESERNVPFLFKTKIKISSKPDPTAGVTRNTVLSQNNSVPTSLFEPLKQLNNQEGNENTFLKRLNESRIREQKEVKLNPSSQEFKSFRCLPKERTRAVSSLLDFSSEASATRAQITSDTQQVDKTSVPDSISNSHLKSPVLINTEITSESKEQHIYDNQTRKHSSDFCKFLCSPVIFQGARSNFCFDEQY